MYNQKIFLFAGIVLAMVSMAYAIEGFPEPNAYPNFNSDKIVNFIDFATFGCSGVKNKSCKDFQRGYCL